MKLAIWIWIAMLPAQAQAGGALADYLRQEIGTMSDALAECSLAEGPEQSWYFKRFWFRARPKASFGIPGVKLEIVPEIELLWDRDYPEGWTAYKPPS